LGKRLHADDQPVGHVLARALIAAQMADLAHLPLRRLAGGGTDNVIYRLGRDLLIRFPRRPVAEAEIAGLRAWLPGLAPGLGLRAPLILRCGAPGLGYPFAWTICQWLPGRDAFAAPPEGMRAARDLAGFLQGLQALPAPAGAPRRGEADRIDLILAGLPPFIAAFAGEADPGLLRDLVARAAGIPAFAGRPVWVHGDLHPLNLLTWRGRLTSVIDWGGLGLGDPAMDLMPGWTLFDATARESFRRAMNPDPDAWARGRALALAKAVMAIPYYRQSNPVFHAVMRRTLRRVIEDPQG